MSGPARRGVLAALAAAFGLGPRAAGAAASADGRIGRFIARAFEMRRLAERSGDQPYGAVVVRGDAIVGEAPSRVVVNRNWDAHAEREAIADARRRLGAADLAGCELFSSSRPCRICESAAHAAGIARMYYGPDGTDGGAPTAR